MALMNKLWARENLTEESCFTDEAYIVVSLTLKIFAIFTQGSLAKACKEQNEPFGPDFEISIEKRLPDAAI